MSSPAEISICTRQDYDQILDDVAYLFGFLSQTEPVGYVHAVAVRTSARRQRLAQELFGHFAEFARRHGCKHVKAITTPSNLESIAFHKSLGMQLLGEPNSGGIPVLPDYAGHGAGPTAPDGRTRLILVNAGQY